MFPSKKGNKSASGLNVNNENLNLGITEGWSCVLAKAGEAISPPAATNQFIYPSYFIQHSCSNFIYTTEVQPSYHYSQCFTIRTLCILL